MLPTPRVAFWERVERLQAQGWRVIDEHDDPPRIRLCRRVALPRYFPGAAGEADRSRKEYLELRFLAPDAVQWESLPGNGDPLPSPRTPPAE